MPSEFLLIEYFLAIEFPQYRRCVINDCYNETLEDDNAPSDTPTVTL